jgi:hypothetical protein
MELPTGPREAVVSWRRTEDRYRDALRLAGAADTLREQDGGRLPSSSWPASSATQRPSPGQLPHDVAQQAWEEGRRWGVDAALG